MERFQELDHDQIDTLRTGIGKCRSVIDVDTDGDRSSGRWPPNRLGIQQKNSLRNREFVSI
jgi:hypothetical protein